MMKKNGSEKSPAKKIAETGILAALTLALAFLESLLPPTAFLPPGAKLGLSNIVVMFSVLTASLPQAVALVLLKAMFALFTKGLSAGFIGLCGGICSAAVMFVFTRKPFARLGCIGVSVLSATAHNLGQLAAASILASAALWAYLPALLVFGAVFGVVTGIVLRAVMPALLRLFLVKDQRDL